MSADETIGAAVLVQDFLSPDPETCLPSTTIGQARQTMQDLHVHHLPVVDDGKLVGMLSDRDLVRPGLDELDDVEAIMSIDVLTTTPDEPLSDAAFRMLGADIHALAVVEDGTLVGLLTTTDCLMALLGAAPAHQPAV